MTDFTIHDAGKEIKASTLLDLKNDVWTTGQGIKIISLVGIKKIADGLGLVEKKFEFNVFPAQGNKQQHVISIWLGKVGEKDMDKWVRGTGEASILNTGEIKNTPDGSRKYEEFSFIDSKYRAAMAEKRALSRAVLSYCKLHDLYGSVEAREFAKVGKNLTAGYDY